MGDSIELNYRATIGKAEDLEELAEELRDVANRQIAEIQSEVRTGWKGQSASLFLARAEREAALVRARAGKLERAAQTLRSSADRIYRLEMTARTIFGG